MNDAMEFIYTSKEVSSSIGIATSTLRTWCIKLEAAGYIFKRADDDKRMFFERDITALRSMKELLDKKHSMEYAVEQVTARFNVMTHSVANDDGETALQPTASLERFPNPTEFINDIRQAVREEIRQEVAAAMEEQNKRIDEHIERRDQQLMGVLRELQENRKKSWWQKLFRS
ncbi:MerR family transcriptional regulator [Paenibacillus assamensis]|uniref:MerR family transcriptional regulator n=1 Tax=Paenibacillus assamensis TaxID=311244 RepID=UPI000491B01E|nr:MerR family transcriptional regulator [Paenibacillus assamensis]